MICRAEHWEPPRDCGLLAPAVMEDGMRLLALVDAPDHVCCRYRIRAFEPALARAGWSLTCQALRRGMFSRPGQLAQAEQFDTVILQRKLLPRWQLDLLRRHARQLLFDFDDAVLFRDSYHRLGPYSARREARFAATVQLADAVIAGNDFLADCALRAGAPAERVRMIPTCIDPGLYPAQAPPYRPADAPHTDLIWIGSGSTLRGLQQQQPLWDRLGGEIPGLRLRIVCDQFPSLKRLPVVPIPWAQEWEARDLAAGQIGVSWLPDDPWSRGKCGLKVLQYQAARLPVIANPVGMQAELIEDGVTGFLPATPEQWVSAVQTLAADAELRRRMGLLGRQRLESDYSLDAWSETFVSTVGGTERPAAWSELEPGRGGGAIPRPFHLRPRRAGYGLRATQASRFDGRHGEA
jgi:glycosyltransferase involved in cell wall biosynthesis